MQTRSRFLILCCLFFSSFNVFAQEQDMTGLWRGYMYNDTTQPNYRYEIAISEKKGKLYGFSHTYFILNDKEYHGVKKIKITRDGDKIVTEDVELVANNYPIKPPKGVRMLSVLNFEMKNNVMMLSGLFSTNRTKQYAPATGYIHVERKSDFRQSALIPHLQELGMVEDLSFVDPGNLSRPNNIPAPKTETVIAPVMEKPIAVKAEPVAAKEKPAEEKAIVKTVPASKPEVKKTVATEKPVVKTTPVKEKPVEEKAVVKTAPATTPETKAAPEKAKPQEAVAVKPVEEKIPAPIALISAVDADKRIIETISALNFKSDSLVITLYDNGEVDGDTVSVLMNGKLIMPRVGLSTNAVRKTIYTKDIEDSIQIVMYAETLGSLPPNTGLLIVYDGADRYEIRFSGDMKKSSAIMFRRKR